jgi:hypothetical protein
MKTRILLSSIATLVCAANLAYASTSRTPNLLSCTDQECTSSSQCSYPCNYCFPYPFPGPRCLQVT